MVTTESRTHQRENTNKSLWILVVFAVFTWSIIPSIARATIYEPGETLEPDCAPGSANCGVATSTTPFALNGQSDSVQSFSVGSSGTDFSISSSGGVHTFNIPNASTLNRGLVTTGTQTFGGTKTFNDGVLIAGNFSLPSGPDVITSGTHNDFDIGTGSFFGYHDSGDVTITGIAGGTDGRIIYIVNHSTHLLTLKNLDSASLANNRIEGPKLTDIVLRQHEIAELIYAPIPGGFRWHLAGVSPLAFNNGGNLFGTTAVLGTNDAYPLDLRTNGATALSLDTSGNGTLSGDLHINGDDLFMDTNSSGALLVADGTNFNPVVLGGDATIATNGVLTLNYSAAQSADATHKGFLTAADWNIFNNKQDALAFTPENSANKSTNILLGTSDTLYPSQNAVKSYVDNKEIGLVWHDAVEAVNVIADTDTPVGSPANHDVYLINTGGDTGAWAAFDAGDLVQYQDDHWVLIKPLTTGDRFGVAFVSTTTPSGSFTGYKDYQIEITGGTPGAFTYSFESPNNNDALFVRTSDAFYSNITFTYSTHVGGWVQLSANVSNTFGNGLSLAGSLVSLGTLTSNWVQSGEFDIVTAGDISVDGGDLKTSTTTASLFNTNATTLNIGGSATAINLGASGATVAGAGALTINSGITSNLTLDSGTTGALNLGTGNDAKTINLGTGNAGNTINVGTNNTVADTIAIGSALDAFSLTSAGLNVTTGGALSGVSTLNTISVSATGLTFAGTGSISSTGSNALTIDSSTTGGVNIGTGASAKTVTIGNTTGATAVNISSGTGGLTFVTGTIGAVSIKSGTTGSVTLDSGTTGALNLGTGNDAKTINLGTGNAGNTINVGTNNTVADTIAIGSALDAFSLTSAGLNVTTGGALSGVASIDTIAYSAATIGFAGTGAIVSGAGTALSVTSGTTGALTLDSGTTGALNLGTGNNAKTVNIGTGTAGNSINIGTNNTTADTIAIGSALDAFSLSSTGLNVSSGGALTGVASIDTIAFSATGLTFAGAGTVSSTGANAITIDSGTTGAVNIGTGSNAKTITLGNVTGATALNINTGTGGSTYTTTNGALSFVTGTGAINVGADAAAKTVTVGNTTGATTVNINSGTGNINLQAAGTGATGRVQVGAGGAGSATPDLLVLDVKSTSGDPTGTAGAMYYNSNTGKFRCYENGAWTNCIGTPAGTFTDNTLSNPVSFGSNSEVWNDTTRPNITVTRPNTNVLVSVAIPGTADDGNNDSAAFTLRRAIGSNPTCASTQVGETIRGSFTTNTGDGWNAGAALVDSGSFSSGNNVRYTVCSSTSGVGDQNVSSITVSLVELGADLAENYYTTDDTIVEGDVVAIDSSLPAGIKKSSGAYDRGVIGIVSTAPGMVLDDGSGIGYGRAVPVALAGRVPVHVSDENGPIMVGDYLTPSSVPGVAMRAGNAGPVIGQALTAYSAEGVGQVVALVKNFDIAGTNNDLLGAISPPITPGDSGRTLDDFVDEVHHESIRDAVAIVMAKLTVGARVLSDFITARITAIRGYFDELFAKKIHTEQICLQKSDGSEVCLSGDDLQNMLGTQTVVGAHETTPIEEESTSSAESEETTPSASQEEESLVTTTSTSTDDEISSEESNESPEPEEVTEPEVAPEPDVEPEPDVTPEPEEVSEPEPVAPDTSGAPESGA